MPGTQLQNGIEKVSTSELSSIERVYEEMDLNDYLVSVSFLLLIIFACIGTYSWVQSISRLPNSSLTADANPLTHMMEGSTSASKLKRKVKKKRNLTAGSGTGAGDATDSTAGTAAISVAEAAAKLGHKSIRANNEDAVAGIVQRKGKTATGTATGTGKGGSGGGEGGGGSTKERTGAEISVALPHGLANIAPHLSAAPAVTSVNHDEADDDASSASGSGSGSGSGTQSMARSAASSVSTGVFEENLVASLHLLLRDGIDITWHRVGAKAAKTVRLGLAPQGDVLQWTGVRLLARHKYELPLRHVASIEYGKNTEVFHRSEQARHLPHDVCFSFVIDSVAATATAANGSSSPGSPMGAAAWATVDFQAASKMERDLLVHGFTLIISDLRRGRSFDHEL